MKKCYLIGWLLPLLGCLNPAFSQTGDALNFSGASPEDYVNLSALSVPTNFTSTSSFTIEFWIKTSDNAMMTVFGHKTSSNNVDGYAIFVNGGGAGKMYIETKNAGFTSAGAITMGIWNHVALAYSNGVGTWYINGNRSGSGSFPITGYTANGPYIGLLPVNLNYGYNGSLDEFRIWNYARSCEEIQQRRNCELTGNEPGLIAYYKFNQGTAGGTNTGVTTLTDATANGYNGTLSRFALSGGTSNWISGGGVITGNTCTGTVSVPEINVQGNGTDIADGAAATAAANHTDFGTGIFSRTFTVSNSGSGPLSITGVTVTGANAGDFTVTSLPDPVVSSGGTATFTVAFTPSAAGVRNAVVHIASNDCDEGDYDFAVSGTATATGLSFDGVNDYIQVAANPVIGSGDFTIEHWLMPTSAAASVVWGADIKNMTPYQFRLDFKNGGNLYASFSDMNSNSVYCAAAATIPQHAWTHVAVVRKGTVCSIYINGMLSGIQSTAGVLNLTPAVPLRIGARAATDSVSVSDPFAGSIDEFRLWNRALCQTEIQNNMNGRLPAPGTQAGLVLYYPLDQGAINGANGSTATAIDASASANNGALYNFALSGSTSNWAAGASAVNGTANTFTASTPSTISENVTRMISGTTGFTGCGPLATITPSGAAAVSGSVTVSQTYDTVVTSWAGHAYLQRHYDITPAADANAATGTVTLYFTQADFTAYNAANGSDPDLPTGSNDAAGIASLRITQYHGSSASGLAGTYTGWNGSGPANVLIDPADNNIVWNGALGRWEITFSVTGFSGFFVTGNLAMPLPVKLEAFSAAKAAAGRNRIEWKMSYALPGERFTIMRSGEGRTFGPIGGLTAGDADNYSFYDEQPLAGTNYYRLKIVETNGNIAYSAVAAVSSDATAGVTVRPQPASGSLTITGSAALNGTVALICDMQGREMCRIVLQDTNTIDIHSWPAGFYCLRLSSGEVLRIMKK